MNATNTPLFTPKFKITDVVTFDGSPRNQIVIARISYIIYDIFFKKFTYTLEGWSHHFEEKDLTLFNGAIEG
jgi:hypothetical protein